MFPNLFRRSALSQLTEVGVTLLARARVRLPIRRRWTSTSWACWTPRGCRAWLRARLTSSSSFWPFVLCSATLGLLSVPRHFSEAVSAQFPGRNGSQSGRGTRRSTRHRSPGGREVCGLLHVRSACRVRWRGRGEAEEAHPSVVRGESGLTKPLTMQTRWFNPPRDFKQPPKINPMTMRSIRLEPFRPYPTRQTSRAHDDVEGRRDDDDGV